eukprot:662027-Pelagomonas_calceolata.AAC.11
MMSGSIRALQVHELIVGFKPGDAATIFTGQFAIIKKCTVIVLEHSNYQETRKGSAASNAENWRSQSLIQKTQSRDKTRTCHNTHACVHASFFIAIAALHAFCVAIAEGKHAT